MKRLVFLVAAIIMDAFLAQTAHATDRPVTIVDDPQVLARLDAKGFDFAGILASAARTT
ncbi:hypothetical protein [Mesorhizobium dulcispinae]|uniref:hypothetical protein n=1 Tax=Mesorhizobium dulcispinae TaxID=3072316 RepID=UPI002A246F64|nr:hypothetical protein [Mesorhizobium sp. VK23D]MDX8517816.1 hypothetical protein [Mesorhizobium sp. VK23D]